MSDFHFVSQFLAQVAATGTFGNAFYSTAETQLDEVLKLIDILRMARQTPKDNARRAMFSWLTDKSIDKWAPATEADLPVEVQSLIAYRNSESEEVQALIASGLDNVRWDLFSDAAKGPTVWAALARKMGPQALRMNLNTLLRHDVFRVAASLRDANVSLGETGRRDMVDYVADRIADVRRFDDRSSSRTSTLLRT